MHDRFSFEEKTICAKINYASMQHQEGDQLPLLLRLRRPSNEQVPAQAVDLFWSKLIRAEEQNSALLLLRHPLVPPSPDQVEELFMFQKQKHA